MKHIVLIGGGSGLAPLLAELAASPAAETTAIVSTFDSGGSTGRLRAQYPELPAVGDLRRVWSTTVAPELAAELERRNAAGHPVGNLLLAELALRDGFGKACRQLLGPRILPVSLDSADLVSYFSELPELVGEHQLDAPPAAYRHASVTALGLTQTARLYAPVKTALATADLLVVGPGSLLGSLLPHFLVRGFAEAFAASPAHKVLVLPAKTEFGYRHDTRAQQIARFPVQFDTVLAPRTIAPHTLARRLLQLL
jgi:uncharacterized cofD-like protein